MLIDTLQQRLREAMKARSTIEKEILRVALGELQTQQARGTTLDDETVEAVLRKLIKSNRETLDLTGDAEQKATLQSEIEVIESLLPKQLGASEIEQALAPVREAITGAKSDGQATGVAMKHLKTAGAAVDGRLVKQVIASMRG